MKFVIRLFLLLATASYSFGQSPSFTNYTIDNGLTSNEVYDIHESKNGVIWFATDKGISAYNGYEFKSFTVKDGLPDNTILGFFEDKKGKIWLRSLNGGLSYIENDHIHQILPKQKFGHIHSLYVDKLDTIWFSIDEAQYKAFSTPNGEYTFKKLEKYYLIKQIDQSKQGVIVGRSIARTPMYYTIDGNEYRIDFSLIGNGRSYFSGVNAYNWSEGEIRIDLGKYILSFKADSIEVIKAFPSPRATLNSINEDAYFIGTSDGAHLMNAQNEIQETFLNGMRITSVIKDSEGGYWFSTLCHGVYYASNLNVHVHKIGADARITGLIRNHQDQLFAFGYYGDIYLENNNKIEKVYDDTSRKSEYLRVEFDSDGDIRTVQDKYSVSIKDGVITNTETSPLLFRLDANHDIHVQLQFVVVINRSSQKIVDQYFIPRRLKHSQVYRHGNVLYIPTLSGLYRFDLHDKLVFLGDQYKELSHRVNAISVDRDNRIWIATNESGVFLLDKKRLIAIQDKGKSIGNICKSILIHRDFVWVSTENGLSKIDLRVPSKITTFGTTDGILSKGIRCMYASGQYIILGHDDGITKFPVNYHKQSIPPLINIDKIWINNILLPKQNTYTLNHNQGHVKINFTGISYNSELRYKYRLMGSATSEWVYTSDRNVEFISIQPGSYTFEVVAINPNGIISQKASSISFTISQPFWTTMWFYALCIVALGIVIYLIIRSRLKKMNEKLDLERKLIDIEQQALRARMNPHFIFNSLNSIQAYILTNDKRTANKYLSEFSKLMRSILENSEKKLITISKELETLNAYARIEALRFKEKFQFTITISDSLDTNQFKIPPLLLQPYVENSIWHGVMHKEEKGSIDVELIDKEDFILCTIEDNGIGRERALEIKESQNKVHESAGLNITSKRIELVNGLYGLDFSVTIIDLKEGSKNTGTRIEIKLPYLS